MKKNKQYEITLFSGGSGNDRFINLIKSLSNIKLNIVINGYDDGKSTGILRKFIPDMLGPSDYRKNLLYLIDEKTPDGKIFKDFLDFRIKKKLNKREFINFLELKKENLLVKKLKIYNLSFEKFLKLKELLDLFLKFCKKNPYLHTEDLSLGNILISSFFLKYKNFNKSLELVQDYLDIKKNKVYNVTNGKNLFLIALLENGDIIEDEEKLVGYRHKYRIEDIFLIKKKFSDKFLNNLRLKDKNYKLKILKKFNIYPNLNDKLKKILLKTDIIIYGPGTQFSSLFPSYLTKSLSTIIAKSKAKKFLITNIYHDNDIINENADSIIKKFNFFLNKVNNKKFNKDKFVNFYFVNKFDDNDINLPRKKNYLTFNKNKNYTLLDWEKGKGLHYPNWLAKSIFKLAKRSHLINSLKKSVLTILVPCLNEKKTISKVLNSLKNLKFEDLNLVIEIIVIDGGSIDGSIEIIKKFKDYKFYSLNNAKKGEALKYGIEKSKGDIITFFPSDDEYEVSDIKKVIEPIILNQSKVVYGSRMIKSMSLDDELKKIYQNNHTTKILSKYGGKLINLVILFLFNKSISDPFTSLKAFDAKILKELKLKTKGFEMDFEIFVKLYKKKYFFLEVPVKFLPRTPKQGKKITSIDGIKCLLYLIFYKFF